MTTDALADVRAWIREEFRGTEAGEITYSRQHGDSGLQAENDLELILPLVAEIEAWRSRFSYLRYWSERGIGPVSGIKIVVEPANPECLERWDSVRKCYRVPT